MLQSLLNYTTKKLVLSHPFELQGGNYDLHKMRGFYVSSGYPQYKRTTIGGSDDNSLFVTLMVLTHL